MAGSEAGTFQKYSVTVFPVHAMARLADMKGTCSGPLYFTRSEMVQWILLRLSPLPPQLIFQVYTFSTGGEGCRFNPNPMRQF